MAFGSGIPIQAGFDLGTAIPLDSRTKVDTFSELESLNRNILYQGLRCYCVETGLEYLWDGREWIQNTLNPSTVKPSMDGEATPGSGMYTNMYALPDHVHPTDTSRASVQYVQSVQSAIGSKITKEINTVNETINKFKTENASQHTQMYTYFSNELTRLENSFSTEIGDQVKPDLDDIRNDITDIQGDLGDLEEEVGNIDQDVNDILSRKVQGTSGLTGGGTLQNDIYIEHAGQPSTEIREADELNQDSTVVVTKVGLDNYGHVVRTKVRTAYDRFTNSTPLYATLGGFKMNETFENVPVNEMFRKLLYPYLRPDVNFNISPGATVREYGNPVDNTTLTAIITKKSDNITGIQFLKNGSNFGNNISDKLTGGTVTLTDSNITDTTTYNVRVTDATGASYTGTNRTYTFVYPAYVGLLATDSPTEDQIKGLEKKIQTPANLTYGCPAFTQMRICIATPPGWTIRQFVDSNGFDNTTSYNSKKINITGLDGTTQEYTFYYNSISSKDSAGFSMTFNRA